MSGTARKRVRADSDSDNDSLPNAGSLGASAAVRSQESKRVDALLAQINLLETKIAANDLRATQLTEALEKSKSYDDARDALLKRKDEILQAAQARHEQEARQLQNEINATRSTNEDLTRENATLQETITRTGAEHTQLLLAHRELFSKYTDVCMKVDEIKAALELSSSAGVSAGVSAGSHS